MRSLQRTVIVSRDHGTRDALSPVREETTFGVPNGPLSTKRTIEKLVQGMLERKESIARSRDTLKVIDRDDKNRRRRPRAEDPDAGSKTSGEKT
jgi:hypothetical protein